MKRDEWFETKWHYLRRFGPLAIGGLICAAIGFLTDRTWLALAHAPRCDFRECLGLRLIFIVWPAES
jgi:hypothetical protein